LLAKNNAVLGTDVRLPRVEKPREISDHDSPAPVSRATCMHLRHVTRFRWIGKHDNGIFPKLLEKVNLDMGELILSPVSSHISLRKDLKCDLKINFKITYTRVG
jgi:hypothetical protein